MLGSDSIPPGTARAITHVIYDMDGVLLDTEPFYTDASCTVCARYGVELPPALKARMIGRPAIDSARILVEALALPISPERFVAEREAILDALFPATEPLPGARELTAHLHAHGIPQAVASSSEQRLFALKTARHRDWFARFAHIVLGDDPEVHAGKPAPDLFLVAARRLGADPACCLVIEDAPAGVTAALAARMAVVAVPDAAMPPTLFADAHAVVATLADLELAAWGLPPLAPSA